MISLESYKALFNWVSKVIPQLLWFGIATLCDWLKKSRATSSTNQKQNQNQSWLTRTRIPALDTGDMYLPRALIGSYDCLRLLWLVRGTLVFGFTTLKWKPLYQTVECFTGYPNTSKRVTKKRLGCASFFNLLSMFGYPDGTLFLVFDILLEDFKGKDHRHIMMKFLLLLICTLRPSKILQNHFMEKSSVSQTTWRFTQKHVFSPDFQNLYVCLIDRNSYWKQGCF